MASCLFGAMLMGLSLGMVRERAQSIWPAVCFHMLASAAAFLMPILL
ncbi:MAG: CPBP family intramembrane metalloprotease [Desulfobacterales bacterium]|nr:CPBP family intramembrane metalloprotease [Desulfobacterales bacterium]